MPILVQIPFKTIFLTSRLVPWPGVRTAIDDLVERLSWWWLGAMRDDSERGIVRRVGKAAMFAVKIYVALGVVARMVFTVLLRGLRTAVRGLDSGNGKKIKKE